MPLQPEFLLRDRYRILGELGHGGMGAVYRGHDENLGVDVAIKENLFVSPESERQFKREATLLAGLRHPNLPRVTDHFVVPDQGQYLVMDFIPGEDAKTLLDQNNGPLPEREVVRWAREILDALQYLHNRPQPILHRDIKPGNVKITPERRAVLVDFGLAKVHDTTQSTTVGAKAFTPGFAPPEQYGLGRTDPRTDIYALGATLYNLLTQKMPADSLERAMGQKQLVPVRELNPSVTPRTAQAIERALGVRPEERFATAVDFAAALPSLDEFTVVARAEDTQRPVEAKPAPPPPAARSRLPVIVGVVAVLAVAGVGGGLWVTGVIGGSPTRTPTAAAATRTVASASSTAPVVAAFTQAPPVEASATPSPSPTETVPPTATPTVTVTQPPTATPRGGGSGQIAFVSDRSGVAQIYLVDINEPNKDRDLQPLTNLPDGACQPAWSPDGQELLFISPCAPRKKDGYGNTIIYKMNVDGSSVQPLIQLVGGVFDADWSGTSIAFVYLSNNRPQIWVARPDGTGATALTRGTAADSHPTWSPDGERLVFLNTTRAGRPTLYWMTKEGGFGEGRSQPSQVTRDIDAGSPDWSPDGQLITFVSRDHIWVVKWDALGFDAQNLTRTIGPNADPDWSPDGRWLTFETWRDNANHDIWIMTSNGGQPVRITENAAWDYQPAWRP